MKKGLLNWLDQALEVAESQPLVETSDAAVSTTALNDGAADAGDSTSGDLALPAEATEQVAADGASVSHGIEVVEVVASLTAAAEATAAHGAVVADVPASATTETTEAHGAVVVNSLALLAVAGESSASADVGSEALTHNGGAMNASAPLVAGESVALDDGGWVKGDGSGDVIIGLPVIIGDGFDEVVTLPLPYEGGTYDYSWSGSSVGDINGDGFDDALVATYGSDAQGNYSCGSHVVFGGAEGIDAGIDPASLDGTNGFRLLAGGGDVYGWAVSGAGDVNGDGFDDLLVGTYGYDADGNYGGTTYLIYGAAAGFASGVDVASLGTVVEDYDAYAGAADGFASSLDVQSLDALAHSTMDWL